VKLQYGFLTLLILLIASCGPREGAVDATVIRPTKILDFKTLYSENCAGCHGREGKGGVAIALGDAVYLALADDQVLRNTTAKGVPGTAMPAFAQSSGGFLTDQQIDAIVTGIRGWAKPGFLSDANPPPYTAPTPGDPTRGAATYTTYCASCHGADGKGSDHASSIVDPAFLTLVSDQSLRTTVIVGRPEMGAPDWRGDVSGKPLSPEQVSDVVAWLSAQRPPNSPKLVGGVR